MAFLLQLPSGLLHLRLGPYVYFRDGLMLIFAASATLWLVVRGEMGRTGYLVSAVGFFAFLFAGYLIHPTEWVNAGIILKTCLLWVSAALLARMIHSGGQEKKMKGSKWEAALVLALMIYGLLEVFIGGLELRSGNYFLDLGQQDVTALGVRLGRGETILGALRVRGLQRVVFTYANLISTFCLIAFVVALYSRVRIARYACAALGGVFLLMVIFSGGRSAMMGLIPALFVLGMVRLRVLSARVLAAGVAMIFLISIYISNVGIGELVKTLEAILPEEYAFSDSRSSFDRDHAWLTHWRELRNAPIRYLIGTSIRAWNLPAASSELTYMDNLGLWFLMYTGALGIGAIAFSIADGFRDDNRDARPAYWALFAGSCVFIVTEGIARESLMFPGAMLLFYSVGCLQAPWIRPAESGRPLGLSASRGRELALGGARW